MRKKVVILRAIPIIAERILNRKFDVDINKSGKVLTREQLYRRVKGASAIIPLLTDRINQPVLDAAGEKLEIVANYAVGFDNLDLTAIADKGVIATNTPGSLTESVAEHSFALMMAVSRRILEGDKYIRMGRYKQWEPMLFYGQPLIGRTVGVVGTGRIGGAFAGLCHNGLRMKVLYTDVCVNSRLEKELGAKRVSLRNLLKQSDVVSLHVPLTPKTKHLITAKEIRLMKKTAIIINTARGSVIKEDDLVRVLEEKRLFGAGLDVLEFEPKLTPGLKALKNVIITPHIASATKEARDMMAKMAARNVEAVLSGHKPINPIFLPKKA